MYNDHACNCLKGDVNVTARRVANSLSHPLHGTNSTPLHTHKVQLKKRTSDIQVYNSMDYICVDSTSSNTLVLSIVPRRFCAVYDCYLIVFTEFSVNNVLKCFHKVTVQASCYRRNTQMANYQLVAFSTYERF
jgi:hypothetical protein